jgi:hypothetical protein
MGGYNKDGSAKGNDYRPPKLPESRFPPVSAGSGGELIVNRDQLALVASNMHSDLQELQNDLNQLSSNGIGFASIDGWDTASAFNNNAFNAYYGITQFYQLLNSAYDMVISTLNKTISNYADAEAESTAAANSVGTD